MRPVRESICTEQGQPVGSDPAPNSVSADYSQEAPSFGIRGPVRQLLRAYGDRRFEFPPTRLNLLLFLLYVNGKPSTLMSWCRDASTLAADQLETDRSRRRINAFAMEMNVFLVRQRCDRRIPTMRSWDRHGTDPEKNAGTPP